MIRYVVQTYKPSVATIRSAEPFARGANKEGSRRRLRIKGAILLTLDSCGFLCLRRWDILRLVVLLDFQSRGEALHGHVVDITVFFMASVG